MRTPCLGRRTRRPRHMHLDAHQLQTDNTPEAVLIPYDESEAYQAWQAQRQKRDAWFSKLWAIAERASKRRSPTRKPQP